MSDLKHQSVADLRKTISWCDRVRDKHKTEMRVKESQIEKLKQEIAEHNRLRANVAEKGRWARIYLARKETQK